jgi:UDP-3-O-[3-hydroxymyristoyl] N-acetylglucosamine deacetylase
LTLSASRLRQTLSSPSERLDGVGLHSGKPSSVRLLPAPAGSGRVFRDLGSGQEISADVRNVTNTERCTVLGTDRYAVSTVEHLLSALSGLDVDDVIIETTGVEAPAMDGSAAPFVDLIERTGTRELDVAVDPCRPERAIMVSGISGECIVCWPADVFKITVVLDYPDRPFIGTQIAESDVTLETYRKEIGAARTYGFVSELDMLRERGLGLGATRENVVAMRDDGYDTELRYPNELARHKMLDLIGDLSLIGRPLQARIFAIKPSHRLNVRLASLLC